MEASSHTQNAGRNTLDKLACHSERGIMNTFILSNIEIQFRHWQNTYMILEIYLTLQNVSWIIQILSRKENYECLANFRIYSETIRNNPVNAESTTGSNKMYGVVTQHERDSYRPNYGTSSHTFIVSHTPKPKSPNAPPHIASKIRQHTIKQQ
jgi:hypothetical protein